MSNMNSEDDRRREEVRHAWGIAFLRFGTLGFMILIPALIGAMLGSLLDAALPGSFSWTLLLIILGIACGFFLSWSWIVKEIRRSNTME